MNSKGYEFANEDVEEIYYELLKHEKIRPLASRRPEEVGMRNHSLYWRYHQFVSHSTQDCFMLKNLLQEFLGKKILVIKEEERPRTANAVSISFRSFDHLEVLKNQPTEEKK